MSSVPLPPPPADEDGVDEFDEEAELPEEEMGVEGMAHITRKMSAISMAEEDDDGQGGGGEAERLETHAEASGDEEETGGSDDEDKEKGAVFNPGRGQQMDMGDASSGRWRTRWVLLKKWEPAGGKVCVLYFDEDPVVAKAQSKTVSLQGCIVLKNATISIVHQDEFSRVGDFYYWGVKESSKDTTHVFACDSSLNRKKWVMTCSNAYCGGRNFGNLPAPPKLLSGSFKEGWLAKMAQKPKVGGWRIRYFSIDEKTREMHYFKSKKTNAHLGIIRLTGAKVVCMKEDQYERSAAFSVTNSQGREYLLAAHNPDDALEWLECIEQLASLPPYMDTHSMAPSSFRKSVIKFVRG